MGDMAAQCVHLNLVSHIIHVVMNKLAYNFSWAEEALWSFVIFKIIDIFKYGVDDGQCDVNGDPDEGDYDDFTNSSFFFILKKIFLVCCVVVFCF